MFSNHFNFDPWPYYFICQFSLHDALYGLRPFSWCAQIRLTVSRNLTLSAAALWQTHLSHLWCNRGALCCNVSFGSHVYKKMKAVFFFGARFWYRCIPSKFSLQLLSAANVIFSLIDSSSQVRSVIASKFLTDLICINEQVRLSLSFYCSKLNAVDIIFIVDIIFFDSVLDCWLVCIQ